MLSLESRVDPVKRGIELRKTLVYRHPGLDQLKVLCVNFENTVQKQDLSKGHFKDEGTNTYPYRCKVNVKNFDPELRAAKKLPPFNFKDTKAILEELNIEFDIPHWFLHKAGDKLENILPYDMPLIYQLKGCNYHNGDEIGGCVYCFVDNKSNSGKPEDGVYLSTQNLVDSLLRMNKSQGTKVIRTSGGEPTLVLDHILDLYRKMAWRRINPILAQFDTNLSTGRLIEQFEDEGIYERHILEKIAEYDPKVLVAFKGTSDASIKQNVQADCDVETQIYSLRKLVKAGIDVYPYIYNPDPSTLESFVKKLMDNFENILLRLHIVPLKTYTPTKNRIALIAKEKGLEPEKLLADYQAEWKSNHEKSCEILDKVYWERAGVHLRQVPRPYARKIELKK